MASGQQIAEQNVKLFDAWRVSKLDQNLRQMVSRGVLSRKEIAKECGFAKSALDQNPRIKALLKQTEDDLRLRGILPPLQQRVVSEGELPRAKQRKVALGCFNGGTGDTATEHSHAP